MLKHRSMVRVVGGMALWLRSGYVSSSVSGGANNRAKVGNQGPQASSPRQGGPFTLVKAQNKKLLPLKHEKAKYLLLIPNRKKQKTNHHKNNIFHFALCTLHFSPQTAMCMPLAPPPPALPREPAHGTKGMYKGMIPELFRGVGGSLVPRAREGEGYFRAIVLPSIFFLLQVD